MDELPRDDADAPVGGVPIACIHPDAAHQRARDLLDASGADPFWVESALPLVRCYLMAAAIRGAEVAVAASWSTIPDHAEPLRSLRSRPDVVPDGWLTEFENALRFMDDATRAGIRGTVSAALDAPG